MTGPHTVRPGGLGVAVPDGVQERIGVFAQVVAVLRAQHAGSVVCLSVCLDLVCLSVCVSVCLSVCLSSRARKCVWHRDSHLTSINPK